MKKSQLRQLIKEELKKPPQNHFPKNPSLFREIEDMINSHYVADDFELLINLIEKYGDEEFQQGYEKGIDEASQPENY